MEGHQEKVLDLLLFAGPYSTVMDDLMGHPEPLGSETSFPADVENIVGTALFGTV